MLVISDRVKESSSSNGTGPVVLSGPFGSFQSFADGIGGGNDTYYCIENGKRWEVGQGRYSQLSNSLTREVIFDSSSGGSRIELDGASIVFCTLPADKAIFKDENGGTYVSTISTENLTAGSITSSGDSNFGESVLISGDLSLLGDFIFNGNIENVNNITATGDIASSGFLTLVRPNSAGNFLHAYKNDNINQTIALYVDGNTSPLWRFGLKTNPSDKTAPPTFAYVFARDGAAGVVSNTNNYFSISDLSGFSVVNNSNPIFQASSSTGVYINSISSSQPSFVITGAPLANEDLQRWNRSDDTVLSVVDSGGRFGIMTDNPEYELDVAGSGRMQIIHLNSGVSFPDGTFQTTAYNGLGLTFPSDLTVSLGGGRTFGRYGDGDLIPASGKTPIEVIQLAVVEPQDPTVSLSSSVSNIETGTVNVSVNLTFSYTINNPGASASSAVLEFRRGNSGSWTTIMSNPSLNAFSHNFVNDSDLDINYRYTVIDNQGSQNSSTRNVNFSYRVFYGASASIPTNSSGVRSLPDSRFTESGDIFNLNTGSSYVNFTVAIPTGESLSEVIDLDALNANITSQYLNNQLDVDDAGENPVQYNVYTMSTSIPYSSNHRHRITKG